MWGITRERDATFAQFAEDATRSLSGTAWLLCGDREQAHDLVLTALLETYLAWLRVRHDDALAYARRILVNASVDAWRKRHGDVVSDEAVEAHAPASASGFE